MHYRGMTKYRLQSSCPAALGPTRVGLPRGTVGPGGSRWALLGLPKKPRARQSLVQGASLLGYPLPFKITEASLWAILPRRGVRCLPENASGPKLLGFGVRGHGATPRCRAGRAGAPLPKESLGQLKCFFRESRAQRGSRFPFRAGIWHCMLTTGISYSRPLLKKTQRLEGSVLISSPGFAGTSLPETILPGFEMPTFDVYSDLIMLGNFKANPSSLLRPVTRSRQKKVGERLSVLRNK